MSIEGVRTPRLLAPETQRRQIFHLYLKSMRISVPHLPVDRAQEDLKFFGWTRIVLLVILSNNNTCFNAVAWFHTAVTAWYLQRPSGMTKLSRLHAELHWRSLKKIDEHGREEGSLSHQQKHLPIGASQTMQHVEHAVLIQRSPG